MKIIINRPDKKVLSDLGVTSWSVWECEPSEFPWTYNETETCYLLEGKVTVTAEGEKVDIQKGDLVTFPKGLTCVWKVKERVRKYYLFGD